LGTEISMVWKMDDEVEVGRLAQALKLVKDLKALSELEEKITQLNKELSTLEAKLAKDKEEESQLQLSINNLTYRQNELSQANQRELQTATVAEAL